jgi:DNA primase
MRGLDVARQTLGDSTLTFDPRGTMRQASRLDIELFILTVTGGKDPDDLIREDPYAWQALVENAQPVVDYVIEVGTEHLTSKSTFGDREATARELLPILLATENDLQQHYNVQRLALKLRLDERTLIQWAQQQRRSTRIITKDRSRPTAPPASHSSEADTAQPQFNAPQGSAMERYCISILMQKPRLWSLANRRMRQIAGKKQGVQRGLGPLSSDDFFHSDFRAIINLLEKALAQDDMEPIDFLEEHLPYELRVEVERLLSEPIAAYKQQLLSQMLDREREKVAKLVLRTSDEFLQHVLNLRKQRLIRENQNLYFLLQEADSETGMQYHRQYEANRRALLLIDQTISQMTEMQRTLN